MKFFVPDWDDRVDPGYDFTTDRFTLDRDPYRDDVYAHELLATPPYDGILVSRSALGESGPKRESVERFGMRAYLRMPGALELLGDCGAFGYVRRREPPYETAELVDYYERLGFDYGVSIDHLIVPEFDDQREYRYQLTLRNAEDFFSYHRQRAPRFVPIGAAQGWDVYSYVEAVRALVAMGYSYVALGGLARSNTRQLRELVSSVMAAVPNQVSVHIFGVARSTLLPLFLASGVASVDSAAPLRQAWLSAKDNYYTPDRTYAAIRIPIADEERARAGGTILSRSPLGAGGLSRLRAAEKAALAALRNYDRRAARLPDTLATVMEYDGLLGARLDGQTTKRREQLYRETLRAKPWKHCQCPICRELGVEVIIFRGNNRNRRRGFHNLYAFYHRLQALKAFSEATDYSAQLPLELTPAVP